MIDRTHALPVARQCQMLSLARSTAYYRPREASEANLALMRRIDELHLEHPFAGSRMLRDMLRREGYQTGRKHVTSLMKKMGIEALQEAQHQPSSSRASGLSVPAAQPGNYAPQSRLRSRHHVHPDEARLCVSE